MVGSLAGHRGFAKIKMLSEKEMLLQEDGGERENHTQSVLAHVHYQGCHHEESKATLESGHMIWLPVLGLQWTGTGCELDGTYYLDESFWPVCTSSIVVAFLSFFWPATTTHHHHHHQRYRPPSRPCRCLPAVGEGGNNVPAITLKW